jgi:lysosomal alpha-mannosidase
MVHRRTFVDDRYGVGEALDEHAFGLPLVARGKHLLFLGQQEEGLLQFLVCLFCFITFPM